VIKFYVNDAWQQVARKVEKIMGRKRYHLHNRIGSHDWYVKPAPSMHHPGRCQVGIQDPKMATFIALKL